MTPRLHVHLLPALVPPGELAGATVVVIDVLRATTTMVAVLHHGARDIVPCLEIDEARRAAAALPRGSYLLGGERGGLPIEGFDVGNSPREYTAHAVAGKTVLFTTTNGTRALAAAREAARVMLGAFTNVSRVESAVLRDPVVHLLCAGTDGAITREDVLLAGLLVERLLSDGARELNDEARLAQCAWREVLRSDPAASGMPSEDHLTAALAETQGGKNLCAIGLGADLRDAAAVDRYAVLAELDVRAWRVRRVEVP